MNFARSHCKSSLSESRYDRLELYNVKMAVKDTALHMFGSRCIFSFTHGVSMVNLVLVNAHLCI